MQAEEALRLREEWGNKPCDHPGPLSKEYYLSAATGDYVCTICGRSGWGKDWNRKKDNKQNSNTNKQNS